MVTGKKPKKITGEKSKAGSLSEGKKKSPKALRAPKPSKTAKREKPQPGKKSAAPPPSTRGKKKTLGPKKKSALKEKPLPGVPVLGAGRPRLPFAKAKKSDSLIFLPVRPGQVFAHWELTGRGAPALRFNVERGKRREDFFEIGLKSPSGSAYLNIPPGKRFTVRAGLYGAGGRFSAKIISTALAPRPFPALRPRPGGTRKERLLLPAKYYEFYLPRATSY